MGLNADAPFRCNGAAVADTSGADDALITYAVNRAAAAQGAVAQAELTACADDAALVTGCVQSGDAQVLIGTDVSGCTVNPVIAQAGCLNRQAAFGCQAATVVVELSGADLHCTGSLYQALLAIV